MPTRLIYLLFLLIVAIIDGKRRIAGNRAHLPLSVYYEYVYVDGMNETPYHYQLVNYITQRLGQFHKT